MAQPDISPDSENTHKRPSINKGFRPATDNEIILSEFLQHKVDNFLKLTTKNRLQQIRSETIVDQLYQRLSARIGTAPTEDYKVQNIE